MGEPGDVTPIVTMGEDWWLPERAERSTYGTMYSGYGAGACSNESWNERGERLTTGVGISGVNWFQVQPDGPDDDVEANTLLDDDWWSDRAGYRVWFHLFGASLCANGNPEWLQDAGATTWEDAALHNQGELPLGGSVSERYIESGVTWAEPDSLWTASQGESYLFWDSAYLPERTTYTARWDDYFQGRSSAPSPYAADISDPNAAWVSMITASGECAMSGNYLTEELLTAPELDAAKSDLVDAMDSAFAGDAPALLLGLGEGGRAWDMFADSAAAQSEARLGIGVLSWHGIGAHRFLQHFANLSYDPIHQTYQRTGQYPYSVTHQNLTVFDFLPEGYFEDQAAEAGVDPDTSTEAEWIAFLRGTGVTSARYRTLRFLAAAAIAQDFNSLHVSRWTLPSQDRWCDWRSEIGKSCTDNEWSFDWQSLVDDDQHPAEFLEWTNRTIGRPADDSVEAFCLLAQTGSPNDTGLPFHEALDYYHYDYEDWNEVNDPNWAAEPGLNTPLVTHRGFHCLHDRTIPGGASEPSLEMTADRLGSDVFEAGNGFNQKNWGDAFYEGRRGAPGNDYLYFRLDGDFAEPSPPEDPAAAYVLKVFYEYPEGDPGPGYSCDWRLGYEGVVAGAPGWKWLGAIPPTLDGRIRTATFRVKDAQMAGGGAGGADLAIWNTCTDESLRPSFLMVRVIKDWEP